MRVTGAEHVPADGPLILAANHVSYFDPPVIAAATTRRLSFFAKKELFEFGPFGRYISALGAFPVDRSRGDMAAMRHTLALLKDGHALVIFPEGGRNVDGTAEAKDGVAFLARMSGAAVVPTALSGTEATKRFRPIRVAFGEPMRYDRVRGKDHAALAQWREELMAKITALKTRTEHAR